MAAQDNERTIAEIEAAGRRLLDEKLAEYEGREMDNEGVVAIQGRLKDLLEQELPTTLEAAPSAFFFPTDDAPPRSDRQYREEARRRLTKFRNANPDLGLVTKEDLSGPYGDELLAWGLHKMGRASSLGEALDNLPEGWKREELKQMVVKSAARWEDLVADYRERDGAILEYALRGAGIVNLGVTRTKANPRSVGDVLRMLAYTRLNQKLRAELHKRLIEHTRQLEARPKIGPVGVAILEEPILDASDISPAV